MAQRELQHASDVRSAGRETSDFPLVCETCLGDNPYIRMIRSTVGKECKICARPYTAFRWQPGRKARYKSTITCQACARMKNVCQVCLFDLEYGLPVQVRDKFLEESERVELPESQVGRDYTMGKILNGDNAPYGKSVTASQMLLRLARTQPYYKRNQARICSFWQRGECIRGVACPYRHETDSDHDPNLAEQNIRDRFLGVNDPLANKLLAKVHPAAAPAEPSASSSSS